MNILPIASNYQLNSLRLKEQTGNQSAQTNPNFRGPKSKIIQAGAGLGAAALLGEMAVLQAKKQAEENIGVPTKEEFTKMLEKDGVVSKYALKRWLESYDTDAKNTVDFYNMKDKDGNKYAKENYLSIHRDDIFYKFPELVKQVVDTEDENGLRIFSFRAAQLIVNKTAEYPNGLAKILSLKDDFGNLRFKELDDYAAAEVFEKYPEEAEKYAYAKNETGNYRFSGYEIGKIVNAKMRNDSIPQNPDNRDAGYIDRIETINKIILYKKNGYIKTEDIDSILNLQRNDGSYVYNELPNANAIELFVKEPKLFDEICNIKIPNRSKYLDSSDVESLINSYRLYPQETKCLLQIPAENNFEARFSPSDIIGTRLDAQKIYKAAPKTFMSLASLKIGNYNEDGYRFNMKEICEIIKSVNNEKEISEFTREDIKVIQYLSKIEKPVEGGLLKSKEIIQSFEAYKKYPHETKEIIDNYKTENSWGDEISLIPTEKDVKLYIENREEFDNKYSKQ